MTWRKNGEDLPVISDRAIGGEVRSYIDPSLRSDVPAPKRFEVSVMELSTRKQRDITLIVRDTESPQSILLPEKSSDLFERVCCSSCPLAEIDVTEPGVSSHPRFICAGLDTAGWAEVHTKRYAIINKKTRIEMLKASVCYKKFGPQK